jgi:RND family efflux transporter MFP subunit
MKKNKIIFPFMVVLLLALLTCGYFGYEKNKPTVVDAAMQVADVENLGSAILADGTVGSENEATLHFQTGGKLTYLPFKEGDKVKKDQIVAKLDTFALQKQLTQSLNSFKAVRDNFDQSQQNDQTGIMQGQQKFALDTTNKVEMSDDAKNSNIDDMVKRLLDQQQLSLDSAVANVDLMNYAIQLSSLVSPINGTIIHQDVDVANVNVSPANSFVIADTSNLIFKSNVAEDYIQMIKVGGKAVIKLKGDETEYNGTVSKIYPEKIKLASGQSVYEVDIKSDQLKNAKYNQTGSVTFKLDTNEDVLTVPYWTVQNGQSVWVANNGNPELKTVKTGLTFGDKIQILSGLNKDDKVLTNPEIVVKNKYKFF